MTPGIIKPMEKRRMLRRTIGVLVFLVLAAILAVQNPDLYEVPEVTSQGLRSQETKLALDALDSLEVKGRAPKTNYSRDQFGSGWSSSGGCDTRNVILKRDLKNTVVNSKCQVVAGVLDDPYTGRTIEFQRGQGTSGAVQIDHVVALSDAWQKGAQKLSPEKRKALANDPLELLAVDGPANQQKGDSDAASWLPSNKAFRCQYIARQIAVKVKYGLWVTASEKDSMSRILSRCKGQALPVGF